MEFIISALIGYLLGSINPAYILGKIKGFDIREKGTGNAGASNRKLTMGWPAFFVCAIYDATKAMIAMVITSKIFPGILAVKVLAGCRAVVGHCFPFYLKFKGGKGFASFIGLSFMIDYKACLIILIVGLIFSFLTKYIICATANQIFAFPAYMIISGLFSTVVCLMVISMSVLIVYKHRVNVQKFFRKEELAMDGSYIGIDLRKKK